MAKFLQEFPKAIFLRIAMKSLLDADEVKSGQTTDQTRVPAQQVHNSYSDRWIVLNVLLEFAEAVFPRVEKISLVDTDGVSLARPPTRPEFRIKRSITLDPTVGSCSNFHRSLLRLFSLASKRYHNSTPTASWLVLKSAFFSRFYIIILHLKYQYLLN